MEDGDDVDRPPIDPAERRMLAFDQSVIGPYDMETRDGSWARPFEQMLTERLTTYLGERGIRGVALGHLECRSSHCRADLDFATAEAREAIQSDLFDRTVFGRTGCAVHSMGTDERGAAGQTLVFECGVDEPEEGVRAPSG